MSSMGSVVFVVDDDPSVRDSLRRLLTSVGLTVEVFPSAQAFLQRPRVDSPGCLVLDVRLPGLSGLDLQRELAGTDTALPIVFLTGHGDIPMSVRAMKAGAVEFLTKPFREQDLLDAIRQAIERDRVTRQERQGLAALRERYDSLTPRERDVMARVVAGLLNKQIAADFGTSEATVKEQRGQVMLPLVRAELDRHGIALQTSLATDLPPVLGDRIQLQQVLLNLLVNAAEAMRDVPRERRRLVVRAALETIEDGPSAVVTVEDAGVGFREPDALHLFDPFFTTKPHGLGMGLSISRSIIEGHGGRLWATANPKHGATFHIALPGVAWPIPASITM